ncbi:MAG TPA: cell division protein FtsQ/DivIB [Candidatus Eisenbacteria bacterium]|jgi:cell division septal protein FtsQ|nr:cell division protein FtsQ/DivIB [Candidatus Eisenbacteria bacterium]
MVRPVKTKVRKRGNGTAISVRLVGALRSLLLSSFPYIFVLTLLGVLCGGVFAYAVNSPTFQLQEVSILNIGTLTQQQSFAFCELQPGENLINLDLVNVQQVIKRRHPEFKEVRVRRVLPNRIEVVLKRRTPVAQVHFSSRYVQIDKDLVLLPGSAVAPFRNLTVIEGSPLPRPGLFVGATLADPGTHRAVTLLLSDALRSSSLFKKHVLTQIDIHDPKNVSLFVDGDVEIRLGNAHFKERLEILEQTLQTMNLDRTKVQYVDLRFDDVFIGKR